MEVRDFRDLKVWQMAMELAELTYATCSGLPKTEVFGLARQMQRAAVSVASNIAEGHARQTTKDYLRFVSIAMGSLAELEPQILLAHRLKFLRSEESGRLIDVMGEVGRMLRGSQQSLRAKLALP